MYRDKLEVLELFTKENLEKQLRLSRLSIIEILERLYKSDFVDIDDIEFLENEAINLVKAISKLREIHGKINLANNFIEVIKRGGYQ